MLKRTAQFAFSLAAVLFAIAGCRSTQLPSWQSGPPGSEKQAYQRNDPFPDRNQGPDTMSRPRGYDRQRTESRQAVENRQPDGMPGGYPQSVPPGAMGPSTGEYPQAVPY